MGRYDDILRDIALSIHGLEDTLASDVGRYLWEGINEEGHITKIWQSAYDSYYKYVLDTVTGDVIQTFKDQYYDYMGNVNTVLESVITPTDITDPCYGIPPEVNRDTAMALHKAGHNFNIRNIGGALYIDLDTGCRRPYSPTGSQESDNYFKTLNYENIYYEFTPEMFTEETPHAQDEQPITVVQTTVIDGKPAGLVWVFNKNNNSWVNKETGEVFTPTTKEMVSTDKAGWMNLSPETHLGKLLWVSQWDGKYYSSDYIDVLGDPGRVLNWNTLITGKNPANNRVMYFWPKDTPAPIPTFKPVTVPTFPASPDTTPSIPVSSPGSSPVSLPVSTGQATPTASDIALSWMGAAPENQGQLPEYMAAIFESLGVDKPKRWIDWFGIVLMSLVGSFARLSNEPVDRAIRQYLNEQLPNALPNPTDLVRFELREVFREEDRAKALVIPPSSDFLKYMKEWGFNDYHAASYWAAHWELPSPIQAYEMFQRLRPDKFRPGISFEKEDLSKLLRVLDYRPDFIERLIQIAYQPITRVDIRRMWAMGVIETEEDLYGRYLDLGYSPEDAEYMVRFTLKDAEPTEKTLPKSFYEDEFLEGRLSYNELMDAYLLMGYRKEDAIRMIDALTRKLQRQTEQETARREAGDRADKMLTTEQTIKAFKMGLIDEETAYHKLIRYGYDKNDTQILLDIAWMELGSVYETKKALERAERKTIAEIIGAFVEGETTEEEARSELTAIGRDPLEITALLNVGKAQKR